MKKLLIPVAILAAILLVGTLWWLYHRQPADGTALVLHGNVDIRQVSLAFDGSGRVTELQVQEGDRVKAGAVLARLDVSTLRLQAEQVRAQIDAQHQNVLRLQRGSRTEEIAQARSRAAAAQIDARRAEQDWVRLQEVAASTQDRGISAQDLDRAKAASQVARARSDESTEALQLVERGARKEDIAAGEAQLKGAQAQLALLQHQIELGELKAPADAVVRSRLLEAGDMATPQRPVFALALSGPKWIRVYVGEPDLGQVKPGAAASVVIDSQPHQPLQGVVAFVSPVAEFTPKSVQTEELRTSLVYEVRVRVEDAGDVLRMGQPATVKLSGAPASQ